MSPLALTVVSLALLALPDMKLPPQQSRISGDVNVQLGGAAASGGWMTDYAGAVKLASRAGLPLVLHFDAKWCGACRRMESEVLYRPEVKKLLGNTVIGCRVDADQRKDLIARFGISTLPTEVVINPDGSRGSRYVGYVSLSAYASRLKRIAESNRSAIAKKTSG